MDWNGDGSGVYERNPPLLSLIYPKHLHDLISEVVDDFDGYAPRLRHGEGTGSVAVEGGPGVGVYFSLEGSFEGLVGIVGTEEVGVTNEEALLVVIGVYEPASYAIGAIAADLSGIGVEDIGRR